MASKKPVPIGTEEVEERPSGSLAQKRLKKGLLGPLELSVGRQDSYGGDERSHSAGAGDGKRLAVQCYALSKPTDFNGCDGA